MAKRSNATPPSLRKRYPGEYNSWKAAKQRLAEQDLMFPPEFQTFDQFFAIMGPKQDPDWTLDRKDHTNPEYSLDNVQWAPKVFQTRNRRNTTFLKYTGQKYADKRGRNISLAEWAAITKQNPSTLRGRKKSGWTANEIIDGRRDASVKSFGDMSLRELLAYRPWDEKWSDAQERFYLDNSKEQENRFEFMLRVIEPRRLAALRERHRTTAYYMHDEQDRNDYEDRFGGFDGVNGDWARRPEAKQEDWERLLQMYSAHLAKRTKITKQYAEWRKAVSQADVARTTAAGAKRKRKELHDRYVSRPASNPFSEFDD